MKFDISRPAFMEKAGNGGHNIFLELGISILVFIVVNMIGGMIVGACSTINMFTDPRYLEMLASGVVDIDLIMEIAMDIPDWMSIVNLFCQIFMTVGCVLYCLWFEKRRSDTLGFVKERKVSQYLIGAALGAGLFAAAFGICALFGSVEITALNSFNPVMLILFLAGYLIQGLAEEVFCRGYLMVSIGKRYSTVTAVLVSSLVFAALHLMNPGLTLLAFFNLFLFGVFMALLMVRYNNIWIVGGLHSLWNFVQGNVFGIEVSGTGLSTSVMSSAIDENKAFINGGSFGLEGGLAVTFVLLAGCVFVLISLYRKGAFIKKEKAAVAG